MFECVFRPQVAPGFALRPQDGLVVSVDGDGQAHDLGVKLGWQVLKIDGGVGSKTSLNRCMAGKNNYKINFVERLGKAEPVALCTKMGWSPAMLALLLQVVDPDRKVPLESLDPDREIPTGKQDDKKREPFCFSGKRADIFLELLATGEALFEDRPDASPPVILPRFHDASEGLIIKAADEFTKLCEMGAAKYRVLHATLCCACRFNRRRVVKHLLESKKIQPPLDPRCKFVNPECRPLHVTTSCGFSYLAKLLIDHRADPLEKGENAETPVRKLTTFYAKQTSALEDRIRELEEQLDKARKAKQAAPLPPGSGSVPGRLSTARSFAMQELTAIHQGSSMLASSRLQCSPRAQKHVDDTEVMRASSPLSPRVLSFSHL
jgi:hypothetical protein